MLVFPSQYLHLINKIGTLGLIILLLKPINDVQPLCFLSSDLKHGLWTFLLCFSTFHKLFLLKFSHKCILCIKCILSAHLLSSPFCSFTSFLSFLSLKQFHFYFHIYVYLHRISQPQMRLNIFIFLKLL